MLTMRFADFRINNKFNTGGNFQLEIDLKHFATLYCLLFLLLKSCVLALTYAPCVSRCLRHDGSDVARNWRMTALPENK